MDGPAQTVLLVDGEPLILDVCSAVLKNSGYRVLCSPNARTGLEVFREAPEHVDLVVSDVLMADLSGPDMTNQMIAENPNLKVLYMSGYGQDAITLEKQDNVLDKPFTSERFLHMVRSTLESPAKR